MATSASLAAASKEENQQMESLSDTNPEVKPSEPAEMRAVADENASGLATQAPSPKPQALDAQAAEAARVLAIRQVCAGRHPEIEAQAIQEKWDVNRTALAVLRAERPKAPAVPVHSPEVQCDLPVELHRRNTTSRGQGCCVWTSIHHAALWQNVPAYQEAPKWIQEHGIPGGAYPGAVEKYLPEMARQRGEAEAPAGFRLGLPRSYCASTPPGDKIRPVKMLRLWRPASESLGMDGIPYRKYVELVTERPVERFLARLFLRDVPMRSLCIVSPFIAAMAERRFSIHDIRRKAESEKIPTYVLTREPVEPYQQEAMEAILGSPWIELRYNSAIHAKLYVALGEREADSFGLFGSGNLTSASVESNIELGMLIFGEGIGRDLLRELHYWASVRLRTLEMSRLIQPIRATRS
jgi:hypothetical protein